MPGVPNAHRPGQCRQLMDDDLGLGRGHRGRHRITIQRIGHGHPRAEPVQQVLVRRAPRHAHHVMASRHQQWDERSAENACSAGHKYLHVTTPLILVMGHGGGGGCDTT